MVKIREVGPRDGFQNEPEVIATADKVRLVEMLARTGVKRLEVTSFVRADVIPQLADGAEVLRTADIPDDVSVTVLIPNERGLENALAVRDRGPKHPATARGAAGGGHPASGGAQGTVFQEVNLFLSASETHNRKNVNRSIEESLAGLERVLSRAREEGLRCEGVISVAFGCPYEGEVPRERVIAIAGRLVEAGCEEIAFGDTTGMANPLQVERFFDGLDLGAELTAHFHNTRGQGLANVLAALRAGVDSFESSFGELGGCPVPKGATGNIASEDLVSMLHEMGHDTGIDLEKLVECAREAQRVLGRPLGSHVLTAGPVEWHRE
jgi:hydroxymethylglutaryl-CoA lyase